jgi:hypothetical protein
MSKRTKIGAVLRPSEYFDLSLSHSNNTFMLFRLTTTQTESNSGPCNYIKKRKGEQERREV